MKRLISICILCISISMTQAATLSPRPVTPDASDEAKALLSYLYSIHGEKVLSGQHGMDELEYVHECTGRYPAIRGLDLIHEAKNESVIRETINWWKRGGIPTLMWHWGAPGKGPGYENSKKEIDIDRCFQEGTAEYDAFWADLKRIADHLTVLRDAHVPVLWRPLHECDGDWFWYGKGSGEQFCRVWRTMFDYFARERHLNNLVWVLCHSGEPLASYDPGEGYYDIAGADSYSPERVREKMYRETVRIHGENRPTAYHECGTVPDPDLCARAGVYWTWWMLWSGEHARAFDRDELKRLYAHERVVTLDELPPIMDYLPDSPEVSDCENPGWFNLSGATIRWDGNDFPVVSIAVGLLSDDLERVTGHRPACKKTNSLSRVPDKPSVIAGTLGHSRIIDELAGKGYIDASGLEGKWESYVIQTVTLPGHKTKCLVVAGSDRRGTAYGLTTLSEAAGVSPWYWWADITPAHRDRLFVEPGRFLRKEPSVQYRGIFINDERFGGWARWAEQTFDKESGKVGPKTYEKVFELLLRLKANLLWPAMHNGSQAFNADAENARLADDYAIVMGSSHCEQMLRNNEDEWKNAGTWGDFNYITNRDNMIRYWEERVKTNGAYENIYTLGLRGIHDYPMEGANTTEERVALMQKAIDDQRDILRRNIQYPVEEVPQVLCTYEEVLEAYHNGLKVPDDVTLLWSDDKHGYTRNLCNPAEMNHPGGAGIYYHLSYHGDPASWIWLSPLSPAFISTELTKAYTFGARKIWVFNVGDIKPAEKEISFAMDLAWNIDRWIPEKAGAYMKDWFTRFFGREAGAEMAAIQEEYYRLMASGKDSHVWFVDYTDSDVSKRLESWAALENRAMLLEKSIPRELKAAYFELLEYPVRGASLLNRYQLLSRRSMARAAAADSGALQDAREVKRAWKELFSWTKKYNEELLDGKWKEFFSWQPYHWFRSEKMDAPVATDDILAAVRRGPSAQFVSPCKALSAEGAVITADTDCDIPIWIEALTPIRNFSKAPRDNEFCTVSLGSDAFTASATPINNIWHAPYVGPMWSKVGTLHIKKGDNLLRITDLKQDARIDRIFIGLWPPFEKDALQIIPAGSYSTCRNLPDAGFRTVRGLGFSDGVVLQPFDTPSFDDCASAPYVEYDLTLPEGESRIEVRTLANLHVYEGRDIRYAVQVDRNEPSVFSIHAGDFSAEWRKNVLRGYSCRSVTVNNSSEGPHTLKIYILDPGPVLQEIRIY